MRSVVKSVPTLLPVALLVMATALLADERGSSVRVIRGNNRGTTRAVPIKSELRADAVKATPRADVTRADSKSSASEREPMPRERDERTAQNESDTTESVSESSLGVPLPPGMPRGLINNYDGGARPDQEQAPAKPPTLREPHRVESPKGVMPSTATSIANPMRADDRRQVSNQPVDLEPISVQLPPLGLKDEIAQWLRQLAVVMIGLLVMLPALLLVLKRLVLPGVVIRVELAGSGVAVSTVAPSPAAVAATVSPTTDVTSSTAPSPPGLESAPQRRGAALDLSGGGIPMELLSSTWANEQQNEAQSRAEQEAEVLKCLFESNRDLQNQRFVLAGSATEPSSTE